MEGWSEQKPGTRCRIALCALCREEPLLQMAGYPARGQLSPKASRGLHGTWPKGGQQAFLSLVTVPKKTCIMETELTREGTSHTFLGL